MTDFTNMFTGEFDGNGDPILKEVPYPVLVKEIVKYCNAGLTDGIGEKTGDKGTMCVEAAVSYLTQGNPENDHPKCVFYKLADMKIDLNDWDYWSYCSSDKARGKALRRIAIAQLGTNTKDYQLDWNEFQELLKNKVYTYAIKNTKFSYADVIEYDENYEEVDLVRFHDLICQDIDLYGRKSLSIMKDLIELVVEVLVEVQTPGSKYLNLVGKR